MASDPDRLAALEIRGDALEAFAASTRQAKAWIAEHGTQELVDELRKAAEGRRAIRLGTINALILLEHIKRLEAELAKEPLVLG